MTQLVVVAPKRAGSILHGFLQRLLGETRRRIRDETLRLRQELRATPPEMVDAVRADRLWSLYEESEVLGEGVERWTELRDGRLDLKGFSLVNCSPIMAHDVLIEQPELDLVAQFRNPQTLILTAPSNLIAKFRLEALGFDALVRQLFETNTWPENTGGVLYRTDPGGRQWVDQFVGPLGLAEATKQQDTALAA